MRNSAAQLRLLRVIMTLARYDVIFPESYRKHIPWQFRQMGNLVRLFSKPVSAFKQANPHFRTSKENGLRLAHALERLGPAYIKLGQFMASRSDLFGEAFTEGLSRLKDSADPFPLEQAHACLREAFGEAEAKCFKSLSSSLFAASIAQIHQWKDPDSGKMKAVKILRPDVKKQLNRDIEAFRYAASQIEARVPEARRLKPVAFIETLARTLKLETDFRLEAASQSEMKTSIRQIKALKIPEVDWKHTQESVLVTEWIDGIPLTDSEALKAHKVNRKGLAKLLTQSFLTSALNFGVFHADLHEGNLLALKEKEGLALVDFGIVGRLIPAQRQYLARILYGFLMCDYDFAAEAHFEAGYVPAHHAKAEFASALRAVAEPIFSLESHEVSMGKVLLHLFEITHIFDMQLRPELILLQKTMVQVESTARNLDPYHNIWESSRPVIERWMKKSLNPRHQIRSVLEEALEFKKIAQDLPEIMKGIKKQIQEKSTPSTFSESSRKQKGSAQFYSRLLVLLLFLLCFLLAFSLGALWF